MTKSSNTWAYGGISCLNHETTGENWLSLLLWPSAAYSFSARMEPGTLSPSLSMLKCWLVWSCAAVVTLFMSATAPLHLENPISLQSSLASGSYSLSISVSAVFSEPWQGQWSVIQMSNVWLNSQSLHFHQMWVSVLTGTCCINKHLWWEKKVAHIYRCRINYLEGSLIQCSPCSNRRHLISMHVQAALNDSVKWGKKKEGEELSSWEVIWRSLGEVMRR